ncbi:histidine kinase [Actinomadura sp. ATCC 31491]|uniref:Histidine kinase n=1 Tax=Actinomadura luzonensis TaxID=2805427 RepID=A0ABT0FXG3_9ACTN|nr:histidine kinase [Actinomadura luzonensis]MCK2217039.1 histidine kinase [Actinomadura luzonensis]
MSEVTADPAPRLSGFRRSTLWSVLAVTVFFLAFSAKDWIGDAAVAPAVRAAGGLSLAVTVAALTVLLNLRLRPPTPTGRAVAGRAVAGRAVAGRAVAGWLAAGSVAALACAAILLLVPEYRLWALAPATMVSVGATFLPARRRWIAIAAAALAAGLVGGLADGWRPVSAAFPPGLVLFVAWTTLGLLWSWDVAARLNEARRLSAELAVRDERLRFAADLHDIQGHHLQVIALKSELAARLAETNPRRAAAEMRHVQALAADALRDTRAVVQGYRRTTLEAELANAAKVLAAAGIEAGLTTGPAAGALPAAARHLLGLVVREATTNVLRHSRARRADVAYELAGGTARLRMSNDGAPPAPADPGGTGLRGLAERLAAAGGELSWGQSGDRFTVEARVPAPDEGER